MSPINARYAYGAILTLLIHAQVFAQGAPSANTISTMPVPTLALVQSMVSKGQFDQARQILDEQLASKPQDPQWRFMLGTLQAAQGDRAAARATFDALTREYPELPEPYNNLAVMWAAEGNYGEARAALEAAVRADPANAVAQQNLGDVYANLAALAYQKAQKIQPLQRGLADRLLLLQPLLQLTFLNQTEGRP